MTTTKTIPFRRVVDAAGRLMVMAPLVASAKMVRSMFCSAVYGELALVIAVIAG